MLSQNDKSTRAIAAEAATRQGLRHEQNQDCYLVVHQSGLFAVADGMGGHRDGHLASQAFVEELALISFQTGEAFNDKLQCIEAAYHRVNEQLYGSYLDNPVRDISGSTGLTLVVHEGFAGCQWVGDSRLYLLRQGHLFLISEDHSDDMGRLTRALGSNEDMNVDRRVIETLPGDVLVLCSDGLIKGASETEIADTLAQQGVGAADHLAARAVAGGSSDDITIVVVRIDGDG